MKRIHLYFPTVLFILFAGSMILGCKNDKSEGVSEGLSVKVYSPTKILEGQKVDISGTGLDEVTEVIFPGNRIATTIEVTSSNLISVIAPAGIAAEGGDLIVQSPDETVTARVPVTVANPNYTGMNPTGKLGSGDELTIVGTDLEFFEKAIFPGEDGDIVVNAIDFIRKSTSFLRLLVPKGLRDGPGRINLVTAGGIELLLPEVELVAGPSGEWRWQEVAVVWSGDLPISWGGGLTFQGAWFTGGNVLLKKEDIVRCYITTSGGWPQIKFYTGSWGPISLREDFTSDGSPNNIANKNHFVVDELSGNTYLDFPMTEALFSRFTSPAGILATGDGVTFKKVVIISQVWVEF